MNEQTTFLIITPDGQRHRVSLPRAFVKADGVDAPVWLLARLGMPTDARAAWRLRAPLTSDEQISAACPKPANAAPPPMLCLVRGMTAGSGRAPFDPRQARLRKERLALEKLNTESDYVRVEPMSVLPGSEPERYRVIFLCRGIAEIDGTQRPVFTDKHEVLIHCDDEFPSDVPKLRWETPVWHPNIQHAEPKGVCVNKSEWLGGMGLDDLVRLMFEMAQYKNYHAELSPPFPLDQEAAKWVRDYAEPKGIVNKKRGVSVDNKPFTRPTVTEHISLVADPPPSRIRLITPSKSAATGRIKLLNLTKPELTSTPAEGPKIKIVKSE